MTDESDHDKEQRDQLSSNSRSDNAHDSVDPSQTVIRPAPTPPYPNQPHPSGPGGFTGPQSGPRPDQPNGPQPGWPGGWQG